MNLRVRREAKLDILEGMIEYENEREGLGWEFEEEIDRVFARVTEAPLQFPLCTGVVRMALPHRFPYGVFFFVEGEDSVVVAVHHLHREPHSWSHRL
jgi:toxin ParE1/3/4